MTDIERKQNIQKAIASFGSLNPTEAGMALFAALGYSTKRSAHFPEATPGYFESTYAQASDRFDSRRASLDEWDYADLLFQLTKVELGAQGLLFEGSRVDDTIMESYLFFVVGLKKQSYSRTTLAKITREINKLFPMPVMLLFKHGESLSLAIIDRRLNKKDDMKDVLEKKVTLIKDIRMRGTHRAHVEILFDLSLEELVKKQGARNFVELHRTWRSVLDISALNKKFYSELSNWYFWAMENVRFPDDLEKDAEVRNSTNLIRLITRVIFVWFIREKDLVPEKLFDERELSLILKGFMKDDKAAGYYPAILQNLFFGTLNQRMDERGFAKEGDFATSRTHYGVKNLYRHAELFALGEREATTLFKDVPFLNGGLFDCLDKEDEAEKVQYVDGFSRNPAKQAIVPDFLFFGNERDVDLDEIYGTRGVKRRVKGLIPILSGYKFTIAENTPVEEEVALDPELLGKVFENLLASYNPETRSTARNRTGSFYTPRPIVDYMVDESLKSYLSRQLTEKTGMSEKDAKAGLGILFMYTEVEHAFDKKERDVLIAAIDALKILDPACGSGAYPMGILHKLVYILHKLDSGNELWKERQIKKAESIDDADIRERSLADIESAFSHNELDYGRKLYLIEHCIYGVDIQPIAVQIAKLRFFISLVIDQNKKTDMENLGIRSLPNLETKFVATDSLIGLAHREAGLLRNPEIDRVEDEIKSLRHRYFSARSRKDKLDSQKKDRLLRKQIEALLVADGMEHEEASRIAAFDPYDQNAHAVFFDPEWMFSVPDGFDVVIGNPPYVQIQSYSGRPEQKRWENQEYRVWAKTGDLYCLFYERGFGLLAEGGSLCYITSNKWMRANYGRKMRTYFLENGSLRTLIDFGDSPIFESATTYTNIVLWNKRKEVSRKGAEDAKKKKIHVYDLSRAYEASTSLPELLGKQGEGEAIFTADSFVIAFGEAARVKKRIEEIGKPLKNWEVSINYGIKTGFNEAFIIDQKKYDELVAADPKSAEILKPILRGRDIKRYKAEWAGLYLIASHNGYRSSKGKDVPRVDLGRDYPAVFAFMKKIGEGVKFGSIKAKGKGLYDRDDQGGHWSNLRDCAYFNQFSKDKIIIPAMVDSAAYYFDDGAFFGNDKTTIITGKDIKYICAIQNSSVAWSYMDQIASSKQGGFFEIKPMYISQLPIPPIPADAQKPYEALVDCIQFGHAHGLDFEASRLEAVVDVMVYGLYFEEEMRAEGCYISERVAEIVKAFTDEDTDEFKASYVKKLSEFCGKDTIIYSGLIHSRTVDSVKVVLGGAKK